MLKNKPHSESHAGDVDHDYVLDLLARADFSQATRQRGQLRARLLKKADIHPGKQNRSLRLILDIAGLVILLVGFVIFLTRLLDNYSAPSAPVLPLSASSRPTITATSQARAATHPVGIELSSSQDTVRLAISQPTWKTLWAEIELDEYPGLGDTSQPEKRFFSQAWLEQGGNGLVLTSGEIPASNQFNFTVDFGVSRAILLDQTSLTQYDLPSGATKTTPLQNINQTVSPLAGLDPTLNLVYPEFLAILSSEPRPLRMEMNDGRQAVVADWGNSRLWVDSQTGLLLRVERYTGAVGVSPIQSLLFMRQVLVDLPLDDSIFHPQYLNELHFLPPPAQTLPGPTPTPFASFSSQGWVYLQAAAQPPFEWKVYRLPANCLVDSNPCPDPQVMPGNPDVQISGLVWAPDHSLGLFSDSNHNQMVTFDPKTLQWLRPLKGFFQSQLSWSPDSRQFAALTTGVDDYDMRIVIIQLDGWIVKGVPTSMKGEKQVLGWLDNHTLAVTVPEMGFKGQAPAWAATDFHPGIYRIDITTGQASTLSPEDAKLFQLNLSPDKQWILSQELSAGNNDQSQTDSLSIAHPDGSGLERVLATAANVQTAWSPDSKYLLIIEDGNNSDLTNRISIFNLEKGTLKEIKLPSLIHSNALDLLGWQP